jgi:hypothetical protein
MNDDDATTHHVIDAISAAMMDRWHPDWRAHGDAMIALCNWRIEQHIYPRMMYTHLLPYVYDELYLAVTNTTPNKPPLGAHEEPAA